MEFIIIYFLFHTKQFVSHTSSENKFVYSKVFYSQQISSHTPHEEAVTCLEWLPRQDESKTTLVVGSEDKAISVVSFRSSEGRFSQEGDCDVIAGMGASVDFIVPVDGRTFVTGSKNVRFDLVLKEMHIRKFIRKFKNNLISVYYLKFLCSPYV